MNPAYQIETFAIHRDQLRSELLPKLRDTVFHVTTAAGFEGIRSTGAVVSNANGRLPFTFPQSDVSFGRHRGYVCLFDLRCVSERQLANGLDCFFFLDPLSSARQDPVFLLLAPSTYRVIIPWTPAIRDTGEMSVPFIEAWYPGDLPLTHVNRVLRPNVVRPPESLFEQAHRLMNEKQ